MCTHTITVVGRNRLFNQLLCSTVQRKTTIPCGMADSLADLREDPAEETAGEAKALLLIDALGSGLDEFFHYAEEAPEPWGPRTIPALLNLKRDGGAEPRALKHGVKGYFYLDEDLKVLLKGLLVLLAGETWIPRETLLDIALNGARVPGNGFTEQGGLTHREAEILVHLSAGETNEEIAEKMCISAHTVKAHLYNIYRKIQVENRFQAALWATKNL